MALRTLTIEPLTKVGFAPFGTVIERDGAEIVMINEGTTTRYHALSDVCLLYTSPSPRDKRQSRMPSSA